MHINIYISQTLELTRIQNVQIRHHLWSELWWKGETYPYNTNNLDRLKSD